LKKTNDEPGRVFGDGCCGGGIQDATHLLRKYLVKFATVKATVIMNWQSCAKVTAGCFAVFSVRLQEFSKLCVKHNDVADLTVAAIQQGHQKTDVGDNFFPGDLLLTQQGDK
jgi:hypothetical protein